MDNPHILIRRRLSNLDTTDAKKLAILQKWDRDAFDAVNWLRKNRNLFKMEVFEPAIISVSVPDQRYAVLCENAFGGTSMRV